MSKIRRLLSGVFLLFVTLSLSSCKWAMLDPKGIIAMSEKQLLIDAVLLMLIVVIPVIIISILFAWRYRASNTKAKYRPNDYHSTTIEVVCWGIPLILVIILSAMAWISSHRLDPYKPLKVGGKPIVIQVVSLNWKWLFIYPKQNIATINYLQIPVNRQVEFQITSDAPMNSLEIPQLAGQIFAMAAMRTKLHIMATEIGVYRGFSANYSGDGFADMHFKVHVTSENDYQRWVAKMKRGNKHLTLAEYHRIFKNSENNPPSFYASVRKDLFNEIIMQYMSLKAHLAFDGTKHLKDIRKQYKEGKQS